MIGFIGGGKMAEAIIHGIVSQGGKKIFVAERLEERRQFLAATYGVEIAPSNKALVEACRIIILAVKPQDMDVLLDEIAGDVTADKIVVSIAAGITIASFQQKLKTKNLVRVMPNIPVIVQEGMMGLSCTDQISAADLVLVQNLFASVGKVVVFPEEQMNAFAALAGSGPAFIALFMEALIDAGMQMGLDEQCARISAIQMLMGTAKVLSGGMLPEKLRLMVASPGGMTEAGLRVFEAEGQKRIAAHALKAAQARGNELGK